MKDKDIVKVEMSEKHDPDEIADRSLNRRKALQFIGMGALGVGSVGDISSASPSRKEGKRSYDVERLTGDEKQKLAADARHTPRFKRLRKHFRNEHQLQVDESGVNAYDLTIRSDSESQSYELVVFPLQYDGGDAEIVIILQNGEFVDSRSGIVDVDEETETAHVTLASVENGEVRSQVTQQNLSRKPGTDDASTQISQCGACIEIVHFVCDNGCGLSSIAICAALGLTGGVAGVGCSVIAAYVCWKIDYPGDCRRNTARGLCRYYDYC